MWYLVGFVWIAVMAAIIGAYTRKQRRRTSERAQQMEKLVAELKANPRRMDADDTVQKDPAMSAAVTAFSRKARLLPQRSALLYYVFRTGLPDHEIFASVTLADVVDVANPAAAGQHQQLLRKLAAQRLDLVVCTKQLEVVAAVLTVNGDAMGEPEHFATQCLEAAGIRVLRVDPSAPPRHHQVHALVYG
jgi:hypothetical protein